MIELQFFHDENPPRVFALLFYFDVVWTLETVSKQIALLCGG